MKTEAAEPPRAPPKRTLKAQASTASSVCSLDSNGLPILPPMSPSTDADPSGPSSASPSSCQISISSDDEPAAQPRRVVKYRFAKQALKATKNPMPAQRRALTPSILKRPASKRNTLTVGKSPILGDIKLHPASAKTYMTYLSKGKWKCVVTCQHKYHRDFVTAVFNKACAEPMTKKMCVEMKICFRGEIPRSVLARMLLPRLRALQTMMMDPQTSLARAMSQSCRACRATRICFTVC